MAGWGSLLDRITSWLPIQKPTERLKNELEDLEREKKSIQILNLDIDKEADRKKAKRLDVIIARIERLQQLLKQKAD